jgi:cell division protein FtsI/penicillin-binding protein 2
LAPTETVASVVEEALGFDLSRAFSEVTHMVPPAKTGTAEKTNAAIKATRKYLLFISQAPLTGDEISQNTFFRRYAYHSRGFEPFFQPIPRIPQKGFFVAHFSENR